MDNEYIEINRIELNEVSVVDFLESLKTTTLLEERVKLMLKDPTVLNIIFLNGQLFSRNHKYEDSQFEQWTLSLQETIEFTNAVFDLIETEEKDIIIILSDARIDLCRIENTSFSDLSIRLYNSNFKFNVYKYGDKNPYLLPTPDDLPF